LPHITLTGQGESTLHPELERFVHHAASRGLFVEMTTNANQLDRTMSARLLDAGLRSVTFSISDFGHDYELVYNLNFEQTYRNIMDFLDLRDQFRGADIRVYISIVEHDLNAGKVAEMKAFWERAGADFVFESPQNNRGGACDNAHYFVGTDRYAAEARDLLARNAASTICSTPFFFVFIGWNGQYYVCCSDYRKEDPLGTVFDFGIDEMDRVKLDGMVDKKLKACADCNVDPVNAVREKMFEIDAGVATPQQLDDVVRHYAEVNNRRLPTDIDILSYPAERAASSSS
jgi:MoaA/NifB/PqqE/SkfB family radical SAM enzyme